MSLVILDHNYLFELKVKCVDHKKLPRNLPNPNRFPIMYELFIPLDCPYGRGAGDPRSSPSPEMELVSSEGRRAVRTKSVS